MVGWGCTLFARGMELQRWGRGDDTDHGLELANGDAATTSFFFAGTGYGGSYNHTARELEPAAPELRRHAPFVGTGTARSCNQVCVELQPAAHCATTNRGRRWTSAFLLEPCVNFAATGNFFCWSQRWDQHGGGAASSSFAGTGNGDSCNRQLFLLQPAI